MLVGREANKAKIRNVALVWAPTACSPQTSLAKSQLGPAQVLLTACFWVCTGSAVVLTHGASAALLPGSGTSLGNLRHPLRVEWAQLSLLRAVLPA